MATTPANKPRRAAPAKKPAAKTTSAKKRAARLKRTGQEDETPVPADASPRLKFHGLTPFPGADTEGEDELDLDEVVEAAEPEPTAEELAARNALKAVLLPLLKESLRIKVSSGHFTSPNDRTIEVFLDDELVAEATFDIRSRPEYDG